MRGHHGGKHRQQVQKKALRRRRRKMVTTGESGLDNADDVDLILQKTKLVQDLLGFTGDDISRLFELAVGFLQQHRFDEAVTAFRLLTHMNPYVCDFWIGLGAAQQAIGSFDDALLNYLVAETMDPSRVDTYGYAVDLCIEMHNLRQAKKVFSLGYAYAKSHGSGRASQLLREGLSKLKARVRQEENMARSGERTAALQRQ